MARPLRLEFEGAVYHVTSRGNERAAIFRDDGDREKFLSILGSVVEDEAWILHAYCLMGNHYHLLLETPRGNLSAGMQRLNARYSQRFNSRHRRTGHLLQGRYKAILVERERHLLELCRYVALNPVRARLVDRAADWPWSNYRATAGTSAPPGWLEVDWTLQQFGNRRFAARESYRRFVSQGKGVPSPWSMVRGQIYLGSKGFLEEIRRRLQDEELTDGIPMAQRLPSPLDVTRIQAMVAREFGVPREALTRRRGGEEKMAAIYLARKLSGLSGREVARLFGVRESRVSHVLAEVEGAARHNLQRRLQVIRRRLEGSVVVHNQALTP